MKLLFDEHKRQANLENRGLDFADLNLEFFLTATVVPAKENRFKAINYFGAHLHVVIFKPLGREAISIISMRRANLAERIVYGHDQTKH
jgi:uncharacterized DUF497 family protein